MLGHKHILLFGNWQKEKSETNEELSLLFKLTFALVLILKICKELQAGYTTQKPPAKPYRCLTATGLNHHFFPLATKTKLPSLSSHSLQGNNHGFLPCEKGHQTPHK